MDLQKVANLLQKYHIQTLEELEYYLDLDNKTNECIGDKKKKKKNCINVQCYEDIYVPDCRKIIEIYNKYFRNDIDTKKNFILYLVEHTDKSESSIANYLSCKSCNKQIEKSINNHLKISDSVFKRNFCANLDKKFNYVTLFETEYLSVKQFLVKEHELTKDNYTPVLKEEETMLTKSEEERLFDLTLVSKNKLKENLENLDNLKGSNSYKINLALAAFDRNLIDESSKIVEMILLENTLHNNVELLQLKAKILSINKQDKEAISLLTKLVELEKPNIDSETHNLLAASIKRDAFNEFSRTKDEEQLKERLSLSKDIYYSIYKLNNDYYPALNYMYLESILAYIEHDMEHIKSMRVEFETIWNNLNHRVNDWWSYISSMEYLILRGEYSKVLFELKKHFYTIDEFEINDFNIISTIRQLELFSEFCTDKELREVINLLKGYSKK